ncbi:MAG: hypothetical protein E7590_05550 [Ruminococcaceae bacterium]|nr:hypothetical protein [Oscillospiraceae bacterium]
MLLSVVALFASCSGKGGELKISKKLATVDLSEAEVVFDAMLSEGGRQKANQLVDQLSDLVGSSLRAKQVLNDGEEIEDDAPLILIGDTGYKESNKVLGKVGDNGWGIQVIGNKIVIVGSNAFLTRMALAFFINNYVNEDAVKGSEISVNKKVEQRELGTMSITNSDGEGQFAMVYNSWTDDYDNGGRDNYNYAGDNNPTTGGADVDYIYEVVEDIRTSLVKATTTAKSRNFPNKLDTTDTENEYEILVGNMQREDYKAELSKLSVNEYGITIKDGKVMLLAWNDATLPYAHDLFKDMLTAYTTEDEDGNSVAVLPASGTIVETIALTWEADFPKPEADGLYLHGTLDVAENCIEYIYAGDGVTEANYLAYCQKLEANGYTTIEENVKPMGTENIFRYYLNEETGSTLYVYYSPYQYAAEQKVKDTLASIRIVSSNTKYIDLADESILNPNQTWTKVTETMVTSLTHDYSVGSWGLAYIITLEDGSFIIFDGGIGTGTNKLDNKDRLWNVLNSLYKKVFGTEPTAAKPIHVRAWMLTHEHSDHMNVFIQFLKTYGKRSNFRFDNFLFNATSDSEQINSNNPQSSVRKGLEGLKSSVNGGFKYLKVHTGQKFYFANCEVDIMGTHEDTYPKKLEYFNNSTTTFKTVLTSTDNAGNKTTTDCIWLGDLERIGSRRLRAMWGENMKADQVQIAHHGGNGVEADLYTLIDAELIWWPTSGNRYVNAANWQNNKTWCNQAAWYYGYGMPGVKMIVMSDGFDYTMKFTTAGIDYDNIYDANSWEKMTPDGRNLIDKRTPAA